MADPVLTNTANGRFSFPPESILDMRRIDKDTFDIDFLAPNGQRLGTKRLLFQAGPILDNGVNGITTEAMLVILIARTKELNNLFPCPENVNAITAMESALTWLNERTRKRTEAGVEGTNQAIQSTEEAVES